MLAFGLHLADEVVSVTLSCTDGPEGCDLGTVLLSDVGHRHRLLMDI
jgi:hypothetical protein